MFKEWLGIWLGGDICKVRVEWDVVKFCHLCYRLTSLSCVKLAKLPLIYQAGGCSLSWCNCTRKFRNQGISHVKIARLRKNIHADNRWFFKERWGEFGLVYFESLDRIRSRACWLTWWQTPAAPEQRWTAKEHHWSAWGWMGVIQPAVAHI